MVIFRRENPSPLSKQIGVKIIDFKKLKEVN
jgi:hypothetical protein